VDGGMNGVEAFQLQIGDVYLDLLLGELEQLRQFIEVSIYVFQQNRQHKVIGMGSIPLCFFCSAIRYSTSRAIVLRPPALIEVISENSSNSW